MPLRAGDELGLGAPAPDDLSGRHDGGRRNTGDCRRLSGTLQDLAGLLQGALDLAARHRSLHTLVDFARAVPLAFVAAFFAARLSFPARAFRAARAFSAILETLFDPFAALRTAFFTVRLLAAARPVFRADFAAFFVLRATARAVRLNTVLAGRQIDLLSRFVRLVKHTGHSFHGF